MRGETPAIRLWLYGLGAFAIVAAISLAVNWGGAGPGILDHQAAGSAARVDEIQAAWREGGVRNLAIVAMLGDLIFIGIYGWGSLVAGRSFMRSGRPELRFAGVLIAAAAAVFLAADYTETLLQLVQLLQDRGVDWMAATAAMARPVKTFAFMTTFLGVPAALAIRRLAARGA